MLKNYVVCFGYSADDHVMRYILDAMARDEGDGVKFPDRHIFTSSDAGWKNGGGHFIKYEETPPTDHSELNHNTHHLLLDTFVEWAKRYEQGFVVKKINCCKYKFTCSPNRSIRRNRQYQIIKLPKYSDSKAKLKKLNQWAKRYLS